MRNIIYEVKWAYQRVVRGYDDRIFWSFDSHFIKIIPALRTFCSDYLKQEESVRLNKERADIYKRTLVLIEHWESIWACYDGGWRLEEEALAKLAEHFGKNINWYWD